MSLPSPAPSPLASGFRLDRYELLCPIAEGGMASVWIARHRGKHGFEKLVAIKTILPKFAEDARFQGMFLNEARIASRIEHANVAQILDVGEQNGITFLVMEYVDGEPLSTIHRVMNKKAARVPQGVLLRIMADVCGGLHTAHELPDADGHLLGVVHRDVSPQNVLVSMKGVAKLIDFGIANARDRLPCDTHGGGVKGKVRYMAPEQAIGGSTDRRADVWAVGAILYQLLSGKPPYDGDNDLQALIAVTSGRAPPPLPPVVHPAVAAVVDRALAFVAERRFATAAELQQAIEHAMVTARLSTSTSAVADFLREHVAYGAQRRKNAVALGAKAAAQNAKYPGPTHWNAEGTDVAFGADSLHAQAGLGATDAPSAATGPIDCAVTGATLGEVGVAMDVSLHRPSRGRIALASAVACAVLGMGALVVMVAGRGASVHGRAGSDSRPAARSSEGMVPTAPTSRPRAEPAAARPATATAADEAPVARTSAATAAPVTATTATARAPALAPAAPPAARPSHSAKVRIDDGF